MPHQHAGGEWDGRRQLAAGRAGEDLDLDAAGRQLAGQLDDVDVHAAGVAGAGLVERRGVNRQHRHPLQPQRERALPDRAESRVRFPRAVRRTATGNTSAALERLRAQAHAEAPSDSASRPNLAGVPVTSRPQRLAAGRARALGIPTRGTTAPNRLRRVDRWLLWALAPRLRGTSADPAPLVVDLGFGATPVTTVELARRLRRRYPAGARARAGDRPRASAAAQAATVRRRRQGCASLRAASSWPVLRRRWCAR